MQWMVIFLGLGLDAVDGYISGVRSGCSGWSYFWGKIWLQWMVIFLGLGLDAIDGHISGVKSGCSGWVYFWG